MSEVEDILPYLTADLPGTGGVLRQHDEDFRVEEILAYEPHGEGDHVFAVIEKRGLTTAQAAAAMAHALGVAPRDVGWAGMKDRRAVTRQTVSLPPPTTPEAVLALRLPGIEVHAAARHRHKLRTGHLRGNRFVLRLRDTDSEAEVAAHRAQAVLARLAAPPGSPNWFGAQRFGAAGDNAAIGRALVLGAPLPAGVQRPRGRALRLHVSALQSELFNAYLRQRMLDGLFHRVLRGDLLQKRASGGIFSSDAPAHDQARLEAGEVVPTGPMYGHRVALPPEGTPAREREQALLHASGLTLEDFARVGKLGVGTRRPLGALLSDVAVAPAGARTIELSFQLSSGSYATAVVREVVKGLTQFPG